MPCLKLVKIGVSRLSGPLLRKHAEKAGEPHGQLFPGSGEAVCLRQNFPEMLEDWNPL